VNLERYGHDPGVMFCLAVVYYSVHILVLVRKDVDVVLVWYFAQQLCIWVYILWCKFGQMWAWPTHLLSHYRSTVHTPDFYKEERLLRNVIFCASW